MQFLLATFQVQKLLDCHVYKYLPYWNQEKHRKVITDHSFSQKHHTFGERFKSISERPKIALFCRQCNSYVMMRYCHREILTYAFFDDNEFERI